MKPKRAEFIPADYRRSAEEMMRRYDGYVEKVMLDAGNFSRIFEAVIGIHDLAPIYKNNADLLRERAKSFIENRQHDRDERKCDGCE